MNNLSLNFEGFEDEVTLTVNLNKGSTKIFGSIYVSEAEILTVGETLDLRLGKSLDIQSFKFQIVFGPSVAVASKLLIDIDIEKNGTVELAINLYCFLDNFPNRIPDHIAVISRTNISALDEFNKGMRNIINRTGNFAVLELS